MPLMTDSALEHLAASPMPATAIGDEQADQVAHLALMIAQKQARILPPNVARPYRDRTQHEREAMRMGVYRVIQALVLLGWIEPPS